MSAFKSTWSYVTSAIAGTVEAAKKSMQNGIFSVQSSVDPKQEQSEQQRQQAQFDNAMSGTGQSHDVQPEQKQNGPQNDDTAPKPRPSGFDTRPPGM